MYTNGTLVILLITMAINHLGTCYAKGGNGAIVFPTEEFEYSRNVSKEEITRPAIIQSRSGSYENIRDGSMANNSQRKIAGDRIIFKDYPSKKSYLPPVTLGPLTYSTKSPSTISKGNNSINADDEEEYDPRFTTRVRLNCKCKIGNSCADTDDC